MGKIPVNHGKKPANLGKNHGKLPVACLRGVIYHGLLVFYHGLRVKYPDFLPSLGVGLQLDLRVFCVLLLNDFLYIKIAVTGLLFITLFSNFRVYS